VGGKRVCDGVEVLREREEGLGTNQSKRDFAGCQQFLSSITFLSKYVVTTHCLHLQVVLVFDKIWCS
jgi:hypothetical protein